MGGKRTGARKYFYICVAGIIVMSLAGCAALTGLQRKWNARESLAAAQKYMEQGDYEAALRETLKVASVHGGKAPADEALFNIGLIYAHAAYPRKDYEKSVDYFRRLIKIFPHSPFAGPARILIGVLLKCEKQNAENERLGKEVEDLKTTMRKSKQVDLEIDVKKKELLK